MAQIQDTGGQSAKGGKRRPKRGIPTVDMTPMVDLGFLLLTFFVMTSTFSKPKIMTLAYPPKEDKPKDQTDDRPKVNNAITFLLSNDRVFYYENQFYAPGNKDGKPATELQETTFSPDGVRKLLTDKNRYVLEQKAGLDKQLKDKSIADTTYTRLLKEHKGDPQALKVLVKTDDLAKCRNFIDMIDELRIAEIGAFLPSDINGPELELVRAKTKKD
jgi:biopolymer transport protein ExbD